MSITTKSAIALAAMFLALLAGAWLTLELFVRPGFVREEADAHARDVARLQQNLVALERDVRSRTQDYARWDDTYDYIANRNPRYLAENFQDDWFTSYGADFIALADNDGRLLWSRSQRPHAAPATDPALAHRMLNRAQRVASANADPASGITWTPDGPMLFSIARTTRSDGAGAPRGFIIIGRRLDPAALQQQLQVNLTLVRARTAPLELEPRFAALAHAPAITWRTTDADHAMIALRNGNRVTGAVLVQQERRLSALSDSAIDGALALLTILFAAIVAVSWLLLKRIVTARLTAITHHLQLSTEPGPIPADASRDEIGQLTQAYNGLLIHLREALESEQRAQSQREIADVENRVKSAFLANLSHELRTPLNAIIGYSELVAEDLDEQHITTGRADLDQINSASRHLLTLINEILDLSRLERDRLELRPEAFRVDEMLRSVIDAATPLAAAQGNVVHLDLGDDLGVAYTDHIRLRQSLVNVLIHACKRSNNGVIRLRVERNTGAEGDTLRFEISDSGPLLAKPQIEALFEPFVHVADVPGGGARLGLAVTRKLLTMMGGRVEILNKLGRGCLFVVTTPAQMMDVASVSQAAA
jgi:signal transduction histidine kinase